MSLPGMALFPRDALRAYLLEMGKNATARALTDREFEAEEEELRLELLVLQSELLRTAKFSVVILLHGIDGAGRSEAARYLMEWIDPRHVRTAAFRAPSSEERERPPAYRFFRALPPKGKVGLFYESWYTEPLMARVEERIGKRDFEKALVEIAEHEKMLVAEDVLLLKFWFDLPKKTMRARLEARERDPENAYRVTKKEWSHYEAYNRTSRFGAEMMSAVALPEASFQVLDGHDHRVAALAFGRALRDAMKARHSQPSRVEVGKEKPTMSGAPLPRLSGTKPLSREVYEAELSKWHRRLALALRKKRFTRLSPVLVFEGMDAAGKGGAIRRITRALDPRDYELVPISAPTEEERAYPYLHRFWKHAPRDGSIVIFDRSWYGRLLVERVEGFISESAVERAHGEINDFERQLAVHGAIVLKFWLEVSEDVQLERFHERESIAWKNFKIGPDDWRNRSKRRDYDLAAAEMFERTSTPLAPWRRIHADDKYAARIAVLEQTVLAIEAALGTKAK